MSHKFFKVLFLSVLFLSGLVTAGCTGNSGEMGDEPRGLKVLVAPLELPGITDACYDLSVANATGDTIWTAGDPRVTAQGEDQSLPPALRPGTQATDSTGGVLPADSTTICSTQYGNATGGDISYIAPCDASGPDTTNTVTMWVDGFYDANGDIVQWHDPCGATGCVLAFACEENADVQVHFDLTIMRDAAQGFFDIAVNFEDIFCSAKLDCVDEFLLRADGQRDMTAVLGLACTSGDSETCLYANPVTLHCARTEAGQVVEQTWQIDPALGPGNIPENSDILFGAATYRGDEAIEEFDKKYWNVALGLDEAALAEWTTCKLQWSATASRTPLATAAPFATPSSTAYPIIVWNRDIVTNGQLTCSSHPLNVPTPGENLASVATMYTPVSTPAVFAHSTCGAPPGQN